MHGNGVSVNTSQHGTGRRTIEDAAIPRFCAMSEGLHFALLEEEPVRVRGHPARLKEEANQVVRCRL